MQDSFILKCEKDREITFFRVNTQLPKKLDQFLTIQKDKYKDYAFNYIKNNDQLVILQLNGTKLEVK